MSTINAVIKNGDNYEQTFVFERNGEMSGKKKIRSKLIQLFPASVGSLMCIPFGIMLGWPSPTYPKLLSASSPLPITIDQSAMIAGFLMIGNIVSTPVSTWSFFGTKYGIIFGLLGMFIGWIIMWYASDIYFLLSSRIIIGISYGYSVGQLKTYLKDLCSTDLSSFLIKTINFYVFFGVILAYILGYFLSFTNFSVAGMAVTVVILIACCFLPHSPKEYLRFGRIKEAETLIKCLQPDVNVEDEIQKLHVEMLIKEKGLSFFQSTSFKNNMQCIIIFLFLHFYVTIGSLPDFILNKEDRECLAELNYDVEWLKDYFQDNYLLPDVHDEKLLIYISVAGQKK
ncbi:hypothetical protein RN001_014278 [Aquatica leii]|uniref:Uncharacterized protein n=1 Tax=Aquatica leii TaxID=1421715 RepID=A0AAN7SLZ2_9COLE|nr:hypothetical protein RN001_014278 [Aquatica leii]